MKSNIIQKISQKFWRILNLWLILLFTLSISITGCNSLRSPRNGKVQMPSQNPGVDDLNHSAKEYTTSQDFKNNKSLEIPVEENSNEPETEVVNNTKVPAKKDKYERKIPTLREQLNSVKADQSTMKQDIRYIQNDVVELKTSVQDIKDKLKEMKYIPNNVASKGASSLKNQYTARTGAESEDNENIILPDNTETPVVKTKLVLTPKPVTKQAKATFKKGQTKNGKAIVINTKTSSKTSVRKNSKKLADDDFQQEEPEKKVKSEPVKKVDTQKAAKEAKIAEQKKINEEGNLTEARKAADNRKNTDNKKTAVAQKMAEAKRLAQEVKQSKAFAEAINETPKKIEQTMESNPVFTAAMDDFSRKDYNESISKLNKIVRGEKNTNLVNDCYFWLGQSHYGLRQWDKAIDYFRKVAASKNGKQDNAQAMIAETNLQAGKTDDARRAFEQLIEKYPRSSYVPRARKMLQQL
ncbi:MAG: ybgF [Ignavibacteria bacterium]|nr:ybgF [Ignavibacteria bacterium]